MTDLDDRASLSIFSVLWAVAALFHLAKWSLWAESPGNLGMAVAATMVLANPGALLPLAGLFLTQAWVVARTMPHTSNHLFLSGLIGALGLLAIGRMLVRSGMRTNPGGFYRDFAPPARATLLLLFLFTGFSKLNADWFRPEVSCGAELYLDVAGRVPLLPEAAWAQRIAILGTVAIELAVPFLLLTRRLRLVGILLALALLYAIGIGAFFNFAAIAAALVFLFGPTNLAELLRGGLGDLPGGGRILKLVGSVRAWRVVRLGAVAIAGTAVVVTLARPWAGYVAEPQLARGVVGGQRTDLSYVFEAAWWVYGLALAAAILIAVRSGRPRWPSAGSLLAHPVPILAVVPMLAFLAGISPYVGLKTETTFAMFSNLRTEVRPNHLVVRRPLDLLGMQDDLVRIESSTDPEIQALAERGYGVPLSELRAYVRARTRASGPDFALTFVRDGRRREVVEAGRDPELTRPAPFLVRTLVAFRPVAIEGPSPCLH